MYGEERQEWDGKQRKQDIFQHKEKRSNYWLYVLGLINEWKPFEKDEKGGITHPFQTYISFPKGNETNFNGTSSISTLVFFFFFLKN